MSPMNMNRFYAYIWLLVILLVCPLGPGGLSAFCQEEKEAEASAPAAATETKSDAESKPVENKPYAKEAIQFFNEGVELHKSGYLNKAITSYKAAIKADDRIEQAWSNLALLYTAQKNWTKALEAFDKALELKPKSTTSLNGLGTVLFAMKKNKEAMEKWKKVVELDPNFASAYYNMGYAMEMEDKRPEALKAYVKALDISPEMSDAYYRMGLILQNTNHPAQAKLFLAKAVNMDPEGAFIRDAQKQLSTIAHDLDKNRTVLNSGSSSATTSGDKTSSQSSKEASTPSDTKSEAAPKERGGLISSFASKLNRNNNADSKSKKHVDMFVQPPQGETDLKPKPEEGKSDF
ncbi:tetratricopeptide repeat protein [bacterium]|nr:tetratricopeptide repeat protein [bacterium]QQR58824.1 MAG: tetratricopeptide repeat protein [Candidatus Melainabacteria bacterium]